MLVDNTQQSWHLESRITRALLLPILKLKTKKTSPSIGTFLLKRVLFQRAEMFEANLLLFIVFNILSRCYCDEKDGNIAGLFYVFEGFHYANKSSVTWGENGQTDFSVSVSMSSSCATYNCSSSCTDTAWEYDLNKLWGKARCGYHHDHHKDSDR